MSREQLAEALRNWGSRDVMSAYSKQVKDAVKLIVDGDVRAVLDLMGAEWHHLACPRCLGVKPCDEHHMPTNQIVVRVEGSDHE